MRRIFILIGLLATTSIAFGQQANRQSAYLAHHNTLSGLLQHNASPASKNTSVTFERVVAQSTRDNTLNSLNDSVSVNYTLYRTSSYDYNTMLFPYNYPYSTSPMFNNSAGIFTKPQVQFDTFMHWAIDPNTEAYSYYETAIATYDANSSMTGYKDLFADSSFNFNMLYANRFNPAKNIDTAYRSEWQAGVADSAFKQFFTYNTSNLLTKDSTYELHLGVWRLASASQYTYDGSNNLIQIDNYTNTTDTSFLLPLAEQWKYVNTYDGSHRLLTVFSSFFDGTALNPYIKDTFAYTASATYHSSWKEYQYDPINGYWAPMTNMTKVINGFGFPDTVNIQGFDSLTNSWVPQSRYIISYNSSKDPDTLRDYEYNFTAFPATPNYTTVYYYNTVVNATKVNNVAVADNCVVFPNPAGDHFTITGLNVPAGRSVSVGLSTITGQCVRMESATWQGSMQVNVSDLASGIYIITIRNASGAVLHNEQLVKQ